MFLIYSLFSWYTFHLTCLFLYRQEKFSSWRGMIVSFNNHRIARRKFLNKHCVLYCWEEKSYWKKQNDESEKRQRFYSAFWFHFYCFSREKLFKILTDHRLRVMTGEECFINLPNAFLFILFNLLTIYFLECKDHSYSSDIMLYKSTYSIGCFIFNTFWEYLLFRWDFLKHYISVFNSEPTQKCIYSINSYP